MSINNNIKGIKSISIGAPGDGIAGTTLTEYDKIVLNSLTFTGAKSNREALAIENISNYLSTAGTADPATSTFKLLEVTGDDLVALAGGTWTELDKKWDAPITDVDIHATVVLETLPIKGRYAKITFPYAFISASWDGSITQNDLLSVNVDITADIPESEAGVQGSPYTVQWFDVA